MGTRGNPAEIWDYLDLFFLSLAKLSRRKLKSAQDSREFYEEFFNENDVAMMSSGEDMRREYRSRILREAAWSCMPIGAGVLDVGCGTGDNLRYILRDDAHFFGLEYAPKTAEVARALTAGRAHIEVGSATAIPHESGSFDVALCIEVLEHLEDDGVACREIARVLKPQGALILSLPYRHWFQRYLTEMGHFRHYTRSDVVSLLEANGLEVVRFLPNFPRWSRFTNYAYIACRALSVLLRLVGVQRSPGEVRLPWMRRPLMATLFGRLERLRDSESVMDYARVETSTFLIAMKKKFAHHEIGSERIP